SKMDNWLFTFDYCYDKLIQQLKVKNLKGFGIEGNRLSIISAGVVISYLQENYKQQLEHISQISSIQIGEFMFLDESTRKNLELTSTIASGGKEGTLISIMDETQTPMGGRLLKQWLSKPLVSKEPLLKRQNNVKYYYENEPFTIQLQEMLAEISDIERMAARLATGRLNPRELIFLKRTLQTIAEIDTYYHAKNVSFEYKPEFIDLHEAIDLIEKSISEDAPLNIKEGNIIKEGYSEKLDELKSLAGSGKEWVVSYQQKERERTGISSLKIGYNRVFGYYLDVTAVHKDKVPEDYIRKQTLTNSERYITPELKEYEEKILGAEEKIAELEYELFQKIREEISKYISQIQKNSMLIARIDVYCNFAYIAHKYNYVCPQIIDEEVIEIIEGRHPVVEQTLPPGEDFIVNDSVLSNKKEQLLIITGPNMSGKSTYLRQTGLIVLMAQVGSFVPAKSVRMNIVDRIFTRVGASDNLASGESTFMVEMLEAANILNNATTKSMILLDEIGRGTSTFDGLSIAWSIAEYLHNNPKVAAKTLFATHYHELTELAIMYPRIKNYNVAVEEIGDHVVFLRKIIAGGTDNSYG
ncbi:MAG: DNA mismatch repair protein MutS, partial [Calditrichia bacterium]|nr:DNA mismatch repair protein MutS [Calditrichia bacterium]